MIKTENRKVNSLMEMMKKIRAPTPGQLRLRWSQEGLHWPELDGDQSWASWLWVLLWRKRTKAKEQNRRMYTTKVFWMKWHSVWDLLWYAPTNKQKVQGGGKIGHELLIVEAWRFIIPFLPFLWIFIISVIKSKYKFISHIKNTTLSVTSKS